MGHYIKGGGDNTKEIYDMSIPNCRMDKYYNVRKLGAEDKAFIKGFDWCLKWGVDNMFDNLDDVAEKFDIEGEDINLAKLLKNHPKILGALREAIAGYAENSRNDMIVSMVDNAEEKPETAGE
jgi:hypothetical protein